MVDLSRFDAIHDAVYQAALASMQLMEYYCHQTILEVLNYDPRSVQINWPRIRDAVAETMAAQTMPLGFFFFASKEAKKEGYTIASHPEKYIAIGHGKQTYGHGLVSAMPDALVECWMKQTGAQAKGSLEKHKDVYDTAVNGGKLLGAVRSPQQIASDYMPQPDDDEGEDIFG